MQASTWQSDLMFVRGGPKLSFADYGHDPRVSSCNYHHNMSPRSKKRSEKHAWELKD